MDNNTQAQNEVGIVGSGSMGGAMALLFSENGSRVGIFDVNTDNVKTVLSQAKEDTAVDPQRITGYDDLSSLVKSFKPGQPRIFVLSLPHGPTTDKALNEILPLLNQGDIIIDGGNEWWEETVRRQGQCLARGVYFIGCGVSGGYQSARRGPSMSPGGPIEAYKHVEPLLKKWACKDGSGRPCVRYIGPGGAGHYVKMVHNGIEQGMLSVICEAYGLLHTALGLPNSEISKVFTEWNKGGELRNTFLVGIGAQTLQFTKGDGVKDSAGIVDDIEDKVVQDVDNSEGTGVWTVKELGQRHIGGFTIAAAHNLRIISADKKQRLEVAKNLQLPQPSTLKDKGIDMRKTIEAIRLATYGACLASFVQGCNMITKQSNEAGWRIKLNDCIAIWRAGCIIQSDYISDLLEPYFEDDPYSSNALSDARVATEVAKTYDALKETVKLAVEADAVVPALSATLEYLKSVGGKHLPTNFEEVELDYFGHHNYDVKGKHALGPQIGSHHTEWKPA